MYAHLMIQIVKCIVIFHRRRRRRRRIKGSDADCAYKYIRNLGMHV